MPWKHCGEDLHDDALTCPACGAEKASWTVEFNATRQLTVRRRHKMLRIQLLGPGDLPVGGAAFRVEWPGADPVEGTLDEEGFAKVQTPPGHPCEVELCGRSAADVVRVEGGQDEPAGSPDEPARFSCEAGKKLTARLRLANPRWSEHEARVGEEIELAVDAELPDGTAALFRILEHDQDGEHDPVTELEGAVEGGVATARWAYQHVEDSDDVTTDAEREGGYTVPEFLFEVEADGARARSGLLVYQDWFEVEARDTHGEPAAGVEVTLTLADGSTRAATSGEDGVARFEALPPGPVEYAYEPPAGDAADDDLSVLGADDPDLEEEEAGDESLVSGAA